MELKRLPHDLTICKLSRIEDADLSAGFFFLEKTDEEISPWLSIPIGGNQISVRTLDLNRAFSEIADSLDRIVYECFGVTLKRIA